MKRILIAVTLALGALVLNPMVACNNEGEDEFTFGETEMRTAIAGTYVGAHPSTGETVTLTINMATTDGTSRTQSVRSPQCSSRSFIRPAAACMTLTTMDVTGHIKATGASVPESDVSGTFTVYGTELSTGDLFVTLAENAISVSGLYDSQQGGLHEVTYEGVTFKVAREGSD